MAGRGVQWLCSRLRIALGIGASVTALFWLGGMIAFKIHVLGFSEAYRLADLLDDYIHHHLYIAASIINLGLYAFWSMVVMIAVDLIRAARKWRRVSMDGCGPRPHSRRTAK